MNSQIIAESFEGPYFPPQGWHVDAGSMQMWKPYIGNATHGYKSIRGENMAGYSVRSWLVTPPIMLEAGETIQISFDYMVEEVDEDAASLEIWVGPDNDVAEWDENLENLTFLELVDYNTHTITFTATETGHHYFGFYASSQIHNEFSISVDKIIIQESHDCTSTGGLSVNNVSSNSAIISWDTVSGISEWQVQVTQNTLPNESNWSNFVATPTTTLDGLIPGTEYTVYIRSKCGDGEYSVISVPVAFSTLCPDTILAPYSMPFTTESLPDCWSQNGDTDWKFNVYADYGASDAGDHTLLQDYTNYAWVDGSDNTDGKTTTLVSPMIDVSELDAPALEFYVYSSNSESNAYNDFLVEIYNGTDWQPAATLTSGSDGWKFYSIDIESDVNIAQARFTVTGVGDVTYYNDILIDDISFREKTMCFPVQNFTVGNINSSSAQLSWESDNPDAQFDIAYGTYDEIFNGTPDLVGVAQPYTLTDLESSTNYYIYVRANCGDEVGEWSGPYMILTGCEIYTLPYTQDFTTNTISPYSVYNPGYPECWNEASGGSLVTGPLEIGTGNWKPDHSASYGAITNSQSASVTLQGSTENYWLLSPVFDMSETEYEAKIRIAITSSVNSPTIIDMGSDDEIHFVYSQNGGEWQTLKIWSAEDEISTGYHTSLVPLDGINGDTRFAFWTDEGLEDNIMYQFHVDNFEIREKAICPEPVNLFADGMTNEAATLSWDAVENITSWSIAVVPTGSTPEGSDWVDVMENSYQWTGLTEDTTYDFYVQSICGGAVSDIISGPYTFTTRCTPVVAPYTETFVEYQMLPPCWINDPNPLDAQLFVINYWNYTTTATADAAMAGDHTAGGGTNYAWLNTVNYVNQEKARLTTALVDISALENPAFQFYLFSKNTIDDALNHVSVKIYSDTGWQELTTITSYTNNWAEHTIDLSAFAGDSPVQLQFEVLVNSNGGYPGYNQILIDDVSFMEMPSCPAPFNIQITEITDTTALVNWENSPSVDSWEVEYGPSGFLSGEGTIIEISSTPQTTLNDLISGQSYDVYVTGLCSDTEKIIGPATFITEVLAGIDDLESPGVTYYPNPVTDILNISSPRVIDHIEVYNMFGQLVKQYSPDNTMASMEMRGLSSGMYMVKAYSGSAASVFKIIKK